MKNIFLILVLCVIQFYPVQIYPQDSLIMSRIKNIVGDTIDISERNFYRLFPWVSGFNKAVIQQISGGFLDFRIFKVRENLLKDSVLKNFCTSGELLEKLVDVEKERELEAKEFKNGPATILLRTGEIVSGEILSVQKNELHFNEQSSGIEAGEKLNSDRLINKNEIRKIIIRGESYVLFGAGIGLLTGIITGLGIAALCSTISHSSGNGFISIRIPFNDVAPYSCSILGILGALIGVNQGVFESEEDRIFTIDQFPDLSELNKYIR
jgi:hypothetical protein